MHQLSFLLWICQRADFRLQSTQVERNVYNAALSAVKKVCLAVEACIASRIDGSTIVFSSKFTGVDARADRAVHISADRVRVLSKHELAFPWVSPT